MKGLFYCRTWISGFAACGLLIGVATHGRAQTTPPTYLPPSVTIVAPTNGAVFGAPADIAITADVSDVGAYVRSVAFYEGTNQLALFLLDPLPGATNGTIIPVTFHWPNVPPGEYTLTVAATNTHGDGTVSAPVHITVTNAPFLPVVSIYATDPIAVEGTNFLCIRPTAVFSDFCTGTNTATFLIRREGMTNDDLMVFYSIGGTASNGVDYVKIPGNVTIPAGRRFALVTIVPIEDIDPTSRRLDTVILGLIPSPLANPTAGYLIGHPARAAAIILEDRDLPGPGPRPLPDCCFHVCLPGTNGSVFSLQFSTNMVDWSPVCTNMVLKGAIHFVDPDACDSTNRFYRAVPVPGFLGY